MSESEITPTPWVDLFDEVHRIVVGAGDLLRDADRLMVKRGYESAHSQNTVGTETSYHMEQPNKWIAGWFARFYRKKSLPHSIPYVAVFLHDRGGTEDYPGDGERLSEPLIVGGVIRSATDQECAWSYWHSKSWFWHRNGGEATATVVYGPDDRNGQASNTSFAVPLEHVRGLDELERLVIEPLLELT